MDSEQELTTAAVYPQTLETPPPSVSPSGLEEEVKQESTLEDTVIAGLESICNLFDNIYFFKSLGIISEENVLYRRLNKGSWGSRLWFVTLLLGARKSISHLLKILKARSRLKKEMRELKDDGDEDLVKQVLRKKFTGALEKCAILLRDVVFELLQTLAYLAIVTIEVFKISVSSKVIKILEPLSHFITVLRIFSTGFSSLTV